jgi:hypothetical protein
MEYLVGYDHLQCVLENMNDKKQFMKIKGFEKISGYTYKGYSIVNPIHNAEETKYEATILNLNLPHKPKWELHVLTPAHKFKQDNHFSITMWDEHDFLTRRQLTIQTMRSISNFRQTIEEMIDELLKIQLVSAPSSSISVQLYN